MKTKILTLVATLALSSTALFAQTTAPTTLTVPAKPATINQRKEIQQDRIGQGVTSGQLNARETSHLERQEAGIDKEEKGMRAQDNGKLTQQDRKTLNHQQNVESKRIYRDKHNSHKQ
jgi:hypothetical protein